MASKLSHTKKWKALAAVPGIKSKLSGKYHKTRSNVSFINSLYRKLAYEVKHPDRFSAIHARSKQTIANLKGNRHVQNTYLVPLLGFDRVEISAGRILRSRAKRAGDQQLIVRAIQIIGPGRNFVERIYALDPSKFTRGRGRFMVQIGNRATFTLPGMDKGTPSKSAAAMIEAYQWQDRRGIEYLQNYMHLIWYERKPL